MPAKKKAAETAAPTQLKITLTKSLIGAKPDKKLTAESLALSKIGDSATLLDIPSTRGKIKSLSHLITVETI